ncbi:MAG: hypothetical protein HN704_14370 [Bacteroidetes bacterium]|nr:hypothetical protein [Bacteroidota bacterium]MBT6686273.1 hypothetical protein [Bacteroidota bacterium]MBT7142633.1 hypothetical protein [Bacteroidota bacterium]MBT7492781.1 hypothetical protein [Bacteroidota bacterium]
MKTDWIEMIESNIESQKSLIYKKDIKFYGVDKIVKMASIVEKFSKECSVCIQKKTEIEDISKNLGNYLNNSVKLRKEYEHLSDEITEHLKTEHQIFSKTYFASLYSAYGTIAGLLAGFIFGFIFFKENLFTSVLIFWAVGIIVGRFYGLRKDREVAKENRNL